MIKKINYFLISLIYSIPSKVVSVNNSEVKKIEIDKKKYKIFEINNCRLYTDTINNFGVIKNNNLIEGPSYQINNNNYEGIKKNIILKIGTPRKKILLRGNLLSLLSGGGSVNNYFHWLFDVLPRLAIVQKKISLSKINFILFPNISQPFQKETIKLLNLKKKSLSAIKFRHLELSKVYATNHPYIFTKNSHKDSQKIPYWISKWLKKKFIKFSSNKYKFKKIFIDRREGRGRSILNYEEIRSYLNSKGFKFIFLEEYSFKDQISIFNNAKIIIGLHGAGFANLVFCKNNTKVIELRTATTGSQIRNIAKQNNLRFQSICGLSKLKTTIQQGEIKIPLKILKKKLNLNSKKWRGSSVG